MTQYSDWQQSVDGPEEWPDECLGGVEFGDDDRPITESMKAEFAASVTWAELTFAEEAAAMGWPNSAEDDVIEF